MLFDNDKGGGGGGGGGGRGGLTTSYLWRLGQVLMPNHFIGVTSCDLLDQLLGPHIDEGQHDCACIINILDKHHHRGGHWLAVFYAVNKHTLFFWDPYGLPPYNDHILHFLKHQPCQVRYYDQRVQSLWSEMCGYHVLAFLLHKSLRLPTSTYFDLYSKAKNELDINDDISVLFLKSYLKR